MKQEILDQINASMNMLYDMSLGSKNYNPNIDISLQTQKVGVQQYLVFKLIDELLKDYYPEQVQVVQKILEDGKINSMMQQVLGLEDDLQELEEELVQIQSDIKQKTSNKDEAFRKAYINHKLNPILKKRDKLIAEYVQTADKLLNSISDIVD